VNSPTKPFVPGSPMDDRVMIIKKAAYTRDLRSEPAVIRDHPRMGLS